MGKSSAPSAPDPYQTAQAQEQYGTQAALYGQQLNATNSVTPYGSTTWSETGGANGVAPQFTQTTQLTPQQQAILNQQQTNSQQQVSLANKVLGNAQGTLGQPLNFQTSVSGPSAQLAPNTSNVPGIVGQNDLQAYQQQSQNAAYQNEMQYLQPQEQQQQEQLDAQLRNSGAQPGTPAYDNAMKLLTNQTQQANESAYNNSYQTGLAAQQAEYGESANTNQQLYSQDLQSQQAYNAAAGQQFSQNLQGAGFSDSAIQQLQDQYLQDYGTLAGASVINPQASAGSGASVSAPNIMQAFENQYQGQLAQYNSNIASQNADIGAAASIAAASISSGF
jgi:hypothetical protein